MKAKSECPFCISKRITEALFAALHTNGDWRALAYDLTALTLLDTEGLSVSGYEASIACGHRALQPLNMVGFICHSCQWLESISGAVNPSQVEIPVMFSGSGEKFTFCSSRQQMVCNRNRDKDVTDRKWLWVYSNSACGCRLFFRSLFGDSEDLRWSHRDANGESEALPCSTSTDWFLCSYGELGVKFL